MAFCRINIFLRLKIKYHIISITMVIFFTILKIMKTPIIDYMHTLYSHKLAKSRPTLLSSARLHILIRQLLKTLIMSFCLRLRYSANYCQEPETVYDRLFIFQTLNLASTQEGRNGILSIPHVEGKAIKCDQSCGSVCSAHSRSDSGSWI